jgi:hypothetical protein
MPKNPIAEPRFLNRWRVALAPFAGFLAASVQCGATENKVEEIVPSEHLMAYVATDDVKNVH